MRGWTDLLVEAVGSTAIPSEDVLRGEIGAPIRGYSFQMGAGRLDVISPGVPFGVACSKFFARRAALSGRLSLVEQAAFARARDRQQDTSAAQPHRFQGAR